MAKPRLCRSFGQVKALGVVQQMLDRRGVPSGSAMRRVFAHRFKLCGNLLECAIRRGRLDASEQPHEAIIALLWPGTVQQAGLNDTFIDQPPHHAAQPLDRPGGGVG